MLLPILAVLLAKETIVLCFVAAALHHTLVLLAKIPITSLRNTIIHYARVPFADRTIRLANRLRAFDALVDHAEVLPNKLRVIAVVTWFVPNTRVRIAKLLIVRPGVWTVIISADMPCAAEPNHSFLETLLLHA